MRKPIIYIKLLDKLESKTWLAVLIIAISVLMLQALLGWLFGIPTPTYHDEFAYLLSADTFANGRLTNPTHPFHAHFETIYVFHEPTYQAKYPPGQGAFLALGQWLTGLPVVGVWISLALACGMNYWVLKILFPSRWALLGTIFVVCNPILQYWWGQTYWGGAVAMLGGALFFGALFRSQDRLSLSNALALGIGILLMANTRPFEGLVLCLLVAPLVVFHAAKYIQEGDAKKVLFIFVIPIGIMSLALIGWTLYYNATLTGDPFKLPYENWSTKNASVEYIRNFKGSERPSGSTKFLRLFEFYFGPILSLSLLGLWLVHKQIIVQFCLVVSAALIAISMHVSRAWPHYMAPITPLLYALVISSLYNLNKWELNGRRWGRVFVTMIAGAYLLYGIYVLVERIGLGSMRQQGTTLLADYGPLKSPMKHREEIVRCLTNSPGKDLIFVHYAQDHIAHWEWVYNAANIDNSEIVWARELGAEQNSELIAYFQGRRVWRLYPDENPPRLTPYEPNQSGNAIDSCP